MSRKCDVISLYREICESLISNLVQVLMKQHAFFEAALCFDWKGKRHSVIIFLPFCSAILEKCLSKHSFAKLEVVVLVHACNGFLLKRKTRERVRFREEKEEEDGSC